MSSAMSSGRKVIQVGPTLASSSPLQIHSAAVGQHFTYDSSNGDSCLRLNSLFESSHEQQQQQQQQQKRERERDQREPSNDIENDGDGSCFLESLFGPNSSPKQHFEESRPGADHNNGRRASSLMCEAFERSLWSSSCMGAAEQQQQQQAGRLSSPPNGPERRRPRGAGANGLALVPAQPETRFEQPNNHQLYYPDSHQPFKASQYSKPTSEGDNQRQGAVHSNSDGGAHTAPAEGGCEEREAMRPQQMSLVRYEDENNNRLTHEHQQQQHIYPHHRQQDDGHGQHQRQQEEEEEEQQQQHFRHATYSYTNLVQARNGLSRAAESGQQQQQQLVEYRHLDEQPYYLQADNTGYFEQPPVSYYPTADASDYGLAIGQGEPHYCTQPMEELHAVGALYAPAHHTECYATTTSTGHNLAELTPRYADQADQHCDEQADKTYHLLKPQQANNWAGEQQQQRHVYDGSQYQQDAYEAPPTYHQLGCDDGSGAYEMVPHHHELPVVSKQYDPSSELNSCLRDFDNWRAEAGDDEEASALSHSTRRPASTATDLSDQAAETRLAPAQKRPTRARPSGGGGGGGGRGRKQAGDTAPGSSKSGGDSASGAPVPKPSGCSEETRTRLRAFVEWRMELRRAKAAGETVAPPAASVESCKTLVAQQSYSGQQSRLYATTVYSSYADQPPSFASSSSLAGVYGLPWKAAGEQQQPPLGSLGIETIHHFPLQAPGATSTNNSSISSHPLSARLADGARTRQQQQQQQQQLGRPTPSAPAAEQVDIPDSAQCDSTVTSSEADADESEQVTANASSSKRQASQLAAEAIRHNSRLLVFGGRRKGGSESNSNPSDSSEASSSDLVRPLDNEHDGGREEVGVLTRARKRMKQQQQQQQQQQRQSWSPQVISTYRSLLQVQHKQCS